MEPRFIFRTLDDSGKGPDATMYLRQLTYTPLSQITAAVHR
jgi:hypothetical protein